MVYNFSFEERDAQIMVEALTKMPYFQVYELISSIQNQVMSQSQSPEQCPKEVSA